MSLAAGPGDPGAGVGHLVGTAGSQIVLGLVPSHWWAKLGPGVSGSGFLGIQELLLACWWVGPGLNSWLWGNGGSWV